MCELKLVTLENPLKASYILKVSNLCSYNEYLQFTYFLLYILSPCRRIEYCQTADEFYSTMGCLTQEMLERNLIAPPELMQVRDKQTL